MKELIQEYGDTTLSKTTLKRMLGNEKRRLRELSAKYYIFTTVIDYLAFGSNVTITTKELHRILSEQGGYDYKCEVTIVDIELWLVDMSKMGVIIYDRKKGIAEITEKGMEMFRNQTYHSIYASVLEAKHSRKIAQIALWISVLALILTAAGLFFQCVK